MSATPAANATAPPNSSALDAYLDVEERDSRKFGKRTVRRMA
jgi:hypothetical protein